MHLFELTATGANVDLNGVERAFVSIRLPSQSHAHQVVLEYKRPASQTSTQKLTATGSGIAGLNELLRPGPPGADLRGQRRAAPA